MSTRPTLDQVWAARVARRHHAQLLLDPLVRQLMYEKKAAHGDFQGRDVVVDGKWVRSAEGDHELLERRLADIDDRLGERLGVGPRPRP